MIKHAYISIKIFKNHTFTSVIIANQQTANKYFCEKIMNPTIQYLKLGGNKTKQNMHEYITQHHTTQYMRTCILIIMMIIIDNNKNNKNNKKKKLGKTHRQKRHAMHKMFE